MPAGRGGGGRWIGGGSLVGHSKGGRPAEALHLRAQTSALLRWVGSDLLVTGAPLRLLCTQVHQLSARVHGGLLLVWADGPRAGARLYYIHVLRYSCTRLYSCAIPRATDVVGYTLYML